MTMGMRSDFPSTEMQIFPGGDEKQTLCGFCRVWLADFIATFLRRCLMPRRSTTDELKSNPKAQLVREVTPPSPHSQKKPRLHNVVIKDL